MASFIPGGSAAIGSCSFHALRSRSWPGASGTGGGAGEEETFATGGVPYTVSVSRESVAESESSG